MPKVILSLLLVLTISATSAQKFQAYFAKATDTIKSDSKKEISQTFTIRIPKQDSCKDYKVSFSVTDNDFGLPGSDVFLPQDRSMKLDNSKDTLEKSFTIKFKRDLKNDKLLHLKLTGYKKNGDTAKLEDTALSYKIYIKPFIEDSLLDALDDGSEYWIHTGTNVDLLDGIKVKELYVRGSFLVNFKKEEEYTKHWALISFGKNRYFSERDSFSRVRFYDILPTAVPGDSMTVAQGYYNTNKLVETNSVFGGVNYLYNYANLSSPKSKFFFTGGFMVSLQNIRTSYSGNTIIATDTSKVYRKPDSTYRFTPIARESKLREFNYNFNVGFIHILSKKNLNIKTQLLAGWNRLTYPYQTRTSGVNQTTEYKNSNGSFVQLRVDGTVLSPGISLGFEMFIRTGQVPLFNFNFCKVLDIRQIGNLFGKLPTATN